MSSLWELRRHGQSIWLDFLTRDFINENKLQKLVEEDGLTGVTSNPTLFEKALSTEKTYEDPIENLLDQGHTAADVFETLAVEDIQKACDVLRPVYDHTNGNDGFVSLEVSPIHARDPRATLADVRRLFKSVGRPNAMIKIPATEEGLFAIEQAVSEGISINITLIFSLKRYQQVIEAWLSGLRRLAERGGNLTPVASVASFFISRVDTVVDKQLQTMIDNAPESPKSKELESLLGRAAVANAQQAYQIFEKMSVGPAFKALEMKGARLQRPLWASTSPKNPKYRDVYYVEELVGKHTVNTMPLETLQAFKDHGYVEEKLMKDPNESARTLERLEQAGVDLENVGRKLEEEGVRLFSDSYDRLIQKIDKKRTVVSVG